MTYRLALVIIIILWPLFTTAQTDTNSLFNISGQLRSAYNGQPIPFCNITYGRTSGAQADSLGNFVIANIKPGQYKLHFSALCYPRRDTTISIVNQDVIGMKWMISVICSRVGRDSALVDINTNQMKLLLQGGIAPISYKTDKRFSKKYKVRFYDFGDLIEYPCDCLEKYNRTIFEHLDKKYGSKWRINFRPDVPGYRY